MTIEEYICFRTGETNLLKIVQKMFFKPFVSSSFRSFWNYWNPGFGFYLLFYIYKPTQQLLPQSIALMLTFLVSGFLHDILYIFPMVIINGVKFIFPFISVWFLIIALGILMTDFLKVNFKTVSTTTRIAFHIIYLVSAFCVTRYIDLAIS